MENNNNTANKKNNQNKDKEHQKYLKYKKYKEKNLQKGDLLKISSPYHNDYHFKESNSFRLGAAKIRPAFISEETLSPDNKKYFTVTFATSNQRKAQVDFFVHEDGQRYSLNPTRTYIYKEEELLKVQREFIGKADPTNPNGYNFLMKRINKTIPKRDELKEIKSLVKSGDTKKADFLIKNLLPQPTETDIHNKKVHRFAALNYKTATKR